MTQVKRDINRQVWNFIALKSNANVFDKDALHPIYIIGNPFPQYFSLLYSVICLFDAVDYKVMRITERLQLPFIRAICGTYSQRWWPPSRRNENERKKGREKERKRLVWRIMQGGFDGCLEAQNEIHSNVKFKLTYLILWAHTHLRTHAHSADVWNELRQLIFK